MCEISVIIVNYNSSELLKNLILSMEEYICSISYEIIVVDNNSNEYNRNLLLSIEQFRFVRTIKLEKNVGFAAANNQALKYAIGKFILLLNPDILFLENSLTKVLNYRRKYGQPCILGIKLLNPDYSYQESRHTFPTLLDYFWPAIFLNRLFNKSKIFNRINYSWQKPDSICAVDSIKGAFMFMDKEIYNSLGGLDERFFMFSEEIDFCFRAYRMGVKTIFFPETSIIHLGGQSTQNEQLKKYVELYKSMILYIKKYHNYRFTVAFRIILIISSFNRFILNYLIAIFSENKLLYREKGIIYFYTFLWLLTNYIPEKSIGKRNE